MCGAHVPVSVSVCVCVCVCVCVPDELLGTSYHLTCLMFYPGEPLCLTRSMLKCTLQCYSLPLATPSKRGVGTLPPKLLATDEAEQRNIVLTFPKCLETKQHCNS